MPSLLRPALAVTCLGLATLVSACGSVEAPSSAKAGATTDAESVLYVQRADHGMLSVLDAAAGTYRLDLEVGDDGVEWFADRPHRGAGRTSTDAMLQSFGWQRSGDVLGDDPPNAAIAATDDGGAPIDGLVGELISADHEAGSGAVSYVVQREPGSAAVTADRGVHDVSLFVDDAPSPGMPAFTTTHTLGYGAFALAARAVVSTWPDTGEYNQVTLMLVSATGATTSVTTLDPQNPTAGPLQLVLGRQRVSINAITLMPATPDQTGSVYADLVMSDLYGEGQTTYNGPIAGWATTGPLG